MATYVMLTRIAPDALRDPASFERLEKEVVAKIGAELPQVKWLADYEVLGPYDYVDVFEAPDNASATKVSMLIRSYGHATTEVWPATPWTRFETFIRQSS